MSQPEVTSAPCVMHARGEKCGTTWYSFTAHAQTVGTCDKKGRKFTAHVIEDKKSGQITLEMRSGSDVVAGLAFTPPPGPDFS